MFIPVFNNAPADVKVHNMVGVDCTTINGETKHILTAVNKGEVVYVTSFSMEKAIEAAKQLNETHYRYKLATPLRKTVVANGQYEHKRINIIKVKLEPLVMNGIQFAAPNGTFTVESSENHLVGNVTTPFYTVVGPDGKRLTKISQDYILRYTGVRQPEGVRKIATVLVGPEEVSTVWTVSFSNDGKFVYCQSPASSKGMKWMRCTDQFGTNCLEFVESAITRLVLGLSGNYLKEHYLNKNQIKVTKTQSCANCKACRFLSNTDAIEGDSVNPDNASRGTGALKTDGSMINNYICAYSMEAPGARRIDQLNEEQLLGSNLSGYSAAYSEHYRAEALDCSKYHSRDTQYIRNDAHDIHVEGNYILIKTAGIEILFDKGSK